MFPPPCFTCFHFLSPSLSVCSHRGHSQEQTLREWICQIWLPWIHTATLTSRFFLLLLLLLLFAIDANQDHLHQEDKLQMGDCLFEVLRFSCRCCRRRWFSFSHFFPLMAEVRSGVMMTVWNEADNSYEKWTVRTRKLHSTCDQRQLRIRLTSPTLPISLLPVLQHLNIKISACVRDCDTRQKLIKMNLSFVWAQWLFLWLWKSRWVRAPFENTSHQYFLLHSLAILCERDRINWKMKSNLSGGSVCCYCHLICPAERAQSGRLYKYPLF